MKQARKSNTGDNGQHVCKREGILKCSVNVYMRVYMGLGLGIAGRSSIWLERYEEIPVWSCFYKPRDLLSPIYICT